MQKSAAEVVEVWKANDVPANLRLILPDRPEWVALIPRSLALPEVEALFLRDGTQRVNRHILANGSVVLSGVPAHSDANSIPVYTTSN